MATATATATPMAAAAASRVITFHLFNTVRPSLAARRRISMPAASPLPSPSSAPQRDSLFVARRRGSNLSARASSSDPLAPATEYQFSDGNGEVELRLNIKRLAVESSRDVFVDVDDTSLLVRVKDAGGNLWTLVNASPLFGRTKPSETIWYIDEDELVINIKKFEADLKWSDIKESWESLSIGISQLLKGTSIYVIGDSTEVNEAVAKELAIGIGYIPLSTNELLEKYAEQSVNSWLDAEGADSVAEAESLLLERLSSHVRTVVATLGGPQGAASRSNKWRHLHAGFTVWLSISEAQDEVSAKEEARKNMKDEHLGYSNADVIVKIGGWDIKHVQDVARGCLSALKQLTLSDKKLAGKKGLYIRLGCRGDWPNIKPPGWDPSTGVDSTLAD